MIVHVRNTHPHMGRDTYTYEGDVVATPKWVPYDAIALTTTESKFRVRIIDKSNIISIDGQEYKKENKIKSDIQTFSVAGSKGNVYTVSIGSKFKECTCTAFTYRRTCKHINEVLGK